MEEQRLGKIQLAQALQKAAMLEAQLSTQRATKTHLAEQLHSVMQKQWQQALQIISGKDIKTMNRGKISRENRQRCTVFPWLFFPDTQNDTCLGDFLYSL